MGKTVRRIVLAAGLGVSIASVVLLTGIVLSHPEASVGRVRTRGLKPGLRTAAIATDRRKSRVHGMIPPSARLPVPRHTGFAALSPA